MQAVRAYIGLGANLGEPESQVRRAVSALAAIPQTRVLAASSLYRSAPVGHAAQPDFVNAVAEIETRLGAEELLGELLATEARFGRVREFPNAPRTLDLDILLYGERTVREPELTIPHPRIVERAFVLVPLAEIAPETVVPGGARIADLLQNVDASSMIKLPETEGKK